MDEDAILTTDVAMDDKESWMVSYLKKEQEFHLKQLEHQKQMMNITQTLINHLYEKL